MRKIVFAAALAAVVSSALLRCSPDQPADDTLSDKIELLANESRNIGMELGWLVGQRGASYEQLQYLRRCAESNDQHAIRAFLESLYPEAKQPNAGNQGQLPRKGTNE